MSDIQRAREKFRIGDRVRLSQFGRERSICLGRHGKGIVVGFGHQAHTVAVKADGNKARQSYSMNFIELEAGSERR